MEKISNRALISRLYSAATKHLEEEAYAPDDWSQTYQAVQALESPEKMVYIIVKLNQKVTQGGFAAYYESTLGIFAPEVIYVLQEIGATASAEIVTSSLEVVNPKGLLDDDYKGFVFETTLSEEQKAQLHTQDIRYDQLQDIENLEDLLGGYLQNLFR